MAIQHLTPTLEQAGILFNDATVLLEGGVSAQNQAQIINDLRAAQSDLNAILAHTATDNSVVADTSAIHLQNVSDQINLEVHYIRAYGSDPMAGKEVNDIQRDLIDIIQGDSTLAALAKTGFAVVPTPLAPPQPFLDNAAQTTFWSNFVADSSSLGDRAIQVLTSHNVHHQGEINQLVHDIHTYVNDATAFDAAQGGLFSARFENELSHDGVMGTAARALIDGIQSNNLNEVKAAAGILAANAADVNGNNTPLGVTPPVIPSGIPTTFTSFGQVGTVFNDATTKLIGGVYNNGTLTNSTPIVNDLTAVQLGLHQIVNDHAASFTQPVLNDVFKIEQVLTNEIASVKVQSAAGGLNAGATSDIHNDQLAIISIVQHDATLNGLAAPVNGFQPLPNGLHGLATV